MLKNQTSLEKELMYIDLILTFSTLNDEGDSQEFYELYLPVGSNQVDAIRYIDDNLFTEIVELCEECDRDVRDLIKISTASDWTFFSSKTNLPSLPDLGHTCKWYFGSNRNDLDPWEKSLMSRHSFGRNVI